MKKTKKEKQDMFILSTQVRYSNDHAFDNTFVEFLDTFNDVIIKLKFYANEDKRTVTCILVDRNIKCFYDKLYENRLIKYKNTPLCIKHGIPKFENECTLAAIAFCHPDDKFDLEEGMRIAFRKVSRVRFNIIKEIVKEFQNNVYRCLKSEMSTIEDRMEKIDKLLEDKLKRKEKLNSKISQNKVVKIRSH